MAGDKQTDERVSSRELWLFRAVIALSAILMFSPSLGGTFLNWDDDRFVVQNDHVDGLTIDNLVHAFGALRFESYQPLHLVSYMIDGTLWSGNALFYRLHNLFLFIAALLLLFEWLRRLRFETLPALIGTLFFALAPYRVESVAWIACRKDVLMLVFVFAAWHLHLRASGAKYGVGLRSAAALVYIAALLTKSSALVFPAMVFVVDFTLRGKSPIHAFRRMLPYLPPAIVLGAALPFIWSNAALVRDATDTTLFGRLALVGWTLYHYGATILFPFTLSPLYAAPSQPAMQQGWLIVSTVAVIAVAAAVSALKKGASLFKPLGIAALVLVPLVPFLNIIPLYYVVADRYLLLPSIGLAVLAAVLVERGIAKKRRALTLFLFGAILLVMGIAGAYEASRWTTGERLWTHAVTREPDAYWARLKLGETLRVSGKPAGSVEQYREAQRIKPLSPLALGGIFWGELLVDLETHPVENLPPPEKLTSDFLAMANDGPRLRRFAAALDARGLTRAAAVVRERLAP